MRKGKGLISVREKEGNYSVDFASEIFKRYTNEQIASLITHVDGYDVIECITEEDDKGNILKVYVPIPNV